MKSIIKSLFTIFTVLILSIGVTSAYFTDQELSGDQVYTTGSLDISLANEELFDPIIMPGEQISSEFTIQNTGTLPVYFKGYFNAKWDDEELSTDNISFVNLEEYINDSWVSVASATLIVDEEFEYKDENGDLIALLPGEHKVFRVSMALDYRAGNEYQNQTLESSLHLAARQTTEGAQWPFEY